MPRRILRIVWSVPQAFALVGGLTGCALLDPGYFAHQLDTVPAPASVVMEATPVPDCSDQPRDRVSQGQVQQKNTTAGSDFEAEPTHAGASTTRTKMESKPGPAKSEVRDIQQERDCYRRAEQLARQRLNQLQTSTADTLMALDEIKRQLPSRNYQTTR